MASHDIIDLTKTLIKLCFFTEKMEPKKKEIEFYIKNKGKLTIVVLKKIGKTGNENCLQEMPTLT